MKRIVSIQDISCLGRCSLTAALPVISAMGVECAVLPTAVLSAHTAFPGFARRDLTDFIGPVADHWAAQGIRFDAIYTGYLASEAQAAAVCRFFDRFQGPDALLFVDPAMADHGRLYAGFDASFPRAMARVCARANVILPNLTEASLLTGLPYREDYDIAYLRAQLRALAALGPRYATLTGVRLGPGKLGVLAYDRESDRFFSHENDCLPGSFHGTGDVFAAACVGGLMRGLSLEAALALAADFTVEAIRCTAPSPDNWYGVEFERAIPYLVARVTDQVTSTLSNTSAGRASDSSSSV